MKKIITLMIICLFLSTSLSVISQSTHTDYSDDNLKFICSDSNGFNEEKYQRYLQMFEQQNGDLQPLDEVESTNNIASPFIKQGTSDGGLMDSAWPMKCHDNCHTGRSSYSTADNNGNELWAYENDHWIEGSPTIGSDGTIYFGGAYNDLPYYLIALYPNGTLKWHFKTDGLIWGSSPAIDEDGIIYFGSWDNYLYAVHPNGTLKWRSCVGAVIVSSPAIADDGTVYVGIMGPGDNGRVFAVNPDGSKKWYYDTGYWITSDPAIGDDGTIYIGSGDHYFYALKSNGQLKWRFKTGHYIKGPASIADDGTIYVGHLKEVLLFEQKQKILMVLKVIGQL